MRKSKIRCKMEVQCRGKVYKMEKYHHLLKSEREALEQMITQGATLAEMGRALGKDPSGIKREIKRNRERRQRSTYGRAVLCARRASCKDKPRGGCVATCRDFKEPACARRDSRPGACNGCAQTGRCPLDKYFYKAKKAQANYDALLVSSREGINSTEDEIKVVGELIAPLLRQGQSVYQILSSHPEIGPSARCLYRYIEAGVFKAYGVDNFSLKEQVSRRQFSGKYKKRKEPANYTGRRYSDYLEKLKQFEGENHVPGVVEMDTVYNSPSGPYLQTFIFVEDHFMVGRLHGAKDNDSMSSGLDFYQGRLGIALFRALFELLLTDRGTEFEKFSMFENDSEGNARSLIYYCDPMQSAQKPHVENNHNYVRDIIPNGKDLSKLAQRDVDLMFSHINSTPRRSLRGKTPYEFFTFHHGEDVAAMLGVEKIGRDAVVLKPSLIFSK
jgi:IS30 family transposase